MDDVCIVCGRAIEEPDEQQHEEEQQQRPGSPDGGERSQSTSPANNTNNAPAPAHIQRTKSANALASKAAGGKGRHVVHHHHAGHGHGKIRRNHSSGRLVGKGKSALKPMTNQHQQSTSTHSTAANGVSEHPAANSITPGQAEDGPAHAHAAEDQHHHEEGGGRLPEWMAIYCSAECRHQDELRSRLAFADLNEVREKIHPAHSQSQSRSSPSHGLARSYQHQYHQKSAGSPSSSSPTTIAAGKGSVSRSAAFPSFCIASSPLANDSEGSEFDWTQGGGGKPSARSPAPGLLPRRESVLECAYSHSRDGRRYSDGSDSSRLSAITSSNSHSRPRRSSSRTRGSTDSLASCEEEEEHERYAASASASSASSASAPRPDLYHRSTSALSNGLRAMTPIHNSSHSHSHSHSQHGSVSPKRIASERSIGSSAYSATSSSNKSLSPRRPSHQENTAATAAAAMMQRSNSDFISNSTQFSTTLIPPHASGSNASSSLSTSVTSDAAKTFRPSSPGRPGLMPSKSSTTLALSSSGNDIKGTITQDYDYPPEPPHSATASSFKVPAMPRYQMPARHSHRPHHTSHSSIPYLSCSPSSPGSHSTRSMTSTAPSSASASAFARNGELDESDGSGSGSGKKTPFVDPRERHASLTAYGLFHQRTPSTPSLTSLAAGAPGSLSLNPGSYSRSPPQRLARLSSSYDAMSSAGGTISKVIRAQQLAARQGQPNSTAPAASSPRRATFDLSASYATHLHPDRHVSAAQTSESTPSASRIHSFGQSTIRGSSSSIGNGNGNGNGKGSPTGKHSPGRARSTLERVASDHSISSANVGSYGQQTQKRPPALLRPSSMGVGVLGSDGSDGSASSPPSPGLPTPGKEHPTYSAAHRQPSHPAINQLQHEAAYGLAHPRPKPRASFTWDHLPAYVPQYTAMDLSRIRSSSSRSGTSLHSLPEDEGGEQNERRPEDHTRKPKMVREPSNTAPKKRLFYFPEDVW